MTVKLYGGLLVCTPADAKTKQEVLDGQPVSVQGDVVIFKARCECEVWIYKRHVEDGVNPEEVICQRCYSTTIL